MSEEYKQLVQRALQAALDAKEYCLQAADALEQANNIIVEINDTQLTQLEQAKEAIKQAIINKGQNVDLNVSFIEYAQKINQIESNGIDISDANIVQPTDVSEGLVFYNAQGKQTGTLKNVTATLSNNIVTVPAGRIRNLQTLTVQESSGLTVNKKTVYVGKGYIKLNSSVSVQTGQVLISNNTVIVKEGYVENNTIELEQPSGGDSSGSAIKLVKVTKYQTKILNPINLIVSINVEIPPPEDPLWQWDAAPYFNGTYLVTPDTAKELNPLKRIYKHTEKDRYIYVYDDIDYMLDGGMYWTLSSSLNYFGTYYTDVNSDGNFSLTNWWEYGESCQPPTMSIQLTNTVQPRPQIYLCREVIDYNELELYFLIKNNDINYLTFEYTPLEKQIYAFYNGKLIGPSVAFADKVASNMIINNPETIFIFGRSYKKKNLGWSIGGWVTANNWMLPFLVSKQPLSCIVVCEDYNLTTGDPIAFTYRDSKTYYISGGLYAIGENSIEYKHEGMINTGKYSKSYYDVCEKIGTMVLDHYFGYTDL